MVYVYMVQCRDGTLYTGTAKDLQVRMAQHNAGKGAKYTRGRRPVKMVHSEVLENKGEALRREYEIKKWPRSRKLMLIEKFKMQEKNSKCGIRKGKKKEKRCVGVTVRKDSG